MNRSDLEHKLLRGSPLYIGGMPTYKVTLGDMADNNFTQMQNIISILCMDDKEAARFLNHSIEDPSTFLYVYANTLNEYKSINDRLTRSQDRQYLMYPLLDFLSIFFRKEAMFHPKYGFIVDFNSDNPFILNESNYDEFRTILKERNCMMDLDGLSDENPENEMARKLLEKRKRLRDKVKKAKQSNGDDDGLTMADLISIFAEAEHMPLQEVYDRYDMYQFNNQFNRLKIMDDFHVNIQTLLAGASAKDVKLQHWLSKIKQQNNDD